MSDDSYYSNDQRIIHVTLTTEREAELFAEFYAGSIEARDILFENNLRYASLLALRYTGRTNRKAYPDLVAAANLGLLKALESRHFDPSKGRFTTFATKYIIGELKKVYRVAYAVTFPCGRMPRPEDPYAVSFRQSNGRRPKPTDGPNDHCAADVEGFAHPGSFRPEHLDHAVVHTAIAKLAPVPRQLVVLVYLDGLTVKNAAAQLNIGRQGAHKILSKALGRMRTAIEPLSFAA